MKEVPIWEKSNLTLEETAACSTLTSNRRFRYRQQCGLKTTVCQALWQDREYSGIFNISKCFIGGQRGSVQVYCTWIGSLFCFGRENKT